MMARTLFRGALLLGFLIPAIRAGQAQTYAVLLSFNGANGNLPESSLIFVNGSLYGTTRLGGAYDGGTVFNLDKSGHEAVVYSFNADVGGELPVGGVVSDSAGNLYGITAFGGYGNYGTAYEVVPAGHERALYNLGWNFSNFLYEPYAGVVRDSAGNLYGTTVKGAQYGNVYEIYYCGSQVPQCPAKVLYDFTGPGNIDGAYPEAPLIVDAAGNLYGTTYEGGFTNCIIQGSKEGCGTVFKVTPSGKETVLYRFAGGTDGANPVAGLTPDKQGNLYGTTFYGGTYNLGTVFKLDSSGNETILHSFGEGKDGQNPAGGVVLDKAGNIYGTTEFGGAISFGGYGTGTIFEISPDGTETVLHNFNYYPDGAHPVAGLVMDAAGNLYGTAPNGGASVNLGTVFELTP